VHRRVRRLRGHQRAQRGGGRAGRARLFPQAKSRSRFGRDAVCFCVPRSSVELAHRPCLQISFPVTPQRCRPRWRAQPVADCPYTVLLVMGRSERTGRESVMVEECIRGTTQRSSRFVFYRRACRTNRTYRPNRCADSKNGRRPVRFAGSER